jgi:hypothetical protein
MSLNNIDNAQASRTEDELRALVEAVYNSSAGTQETNWLEWKSALDLSTPEGRFAVAKAILGLANRSVAQAQLAFEGVAYMVVGVEPGAAAGVPNFDHATLGQRIKTYADGPRWTPHYIAFSGANVLVIAVEAPQAGDPIHTLQKAFSNGKVGHYAGTIFHRGTAHTEPAGPKEVAMLAERFAASAVAADLARIAAANESRQTSELSSQAKRIGFVMEPVQGGRSGWKVENTSDASISDVTIQTTTEAQIVVYYGRGPEWLDDYREGVVGAGQTTQRMFRPADSDAGAAADWSEVERLAVTFRDANNVRWRRVGTQPAEPLDA